MILKALAPRSNTRKGLLLLVSLFVCSAVFYTLLIFTLIIFTLPSFTLAQPRHDSPDFGAEIVYPPEGSPDALPLPVEQVEDTGLPAIGSLDKEKRSGKSKSAAKKTPTTSSEEDSGDENLTGADAEDSEGAAGEQSEDGTLTSLNLNEVDISTLAKTFSKLTKRTYILDSNVKGKITIHQPSKVSIDEALRIFDTVLLLKGFTTVPLGKDVFKIIPAKDARQTTIPLVTKSPADPTDVLVTRLLRLRYVTAEEIQPVLSQFVSKDGLVNAFTGTNSLILIDSEANIDRLVDILKELDVPALDQDITIISIQHAEAKDVSEKITEILGEKEGAQSSGATGVRNTPRPVVPTPGVNPATPGIRPASAAGQGSGERRLPLKIIPDERTNSLIVVADQDLTTKVKALVEQLDSEVDRSGGKFYVYRLKHADAEDLAGILSAVINGGEVPSRSSGPSTGSSLSRSSRESNRSGRSRDRNSNFFGGGSSSNSSFNSAARGQLRETTFRPSTPGDSKVNFEGEVNIAPDPATNSLIINASRADYQKVKQVIDELDVKRRQVIVEATILEVSLDKNLDLGTELTGTVANSSAGVLANTNFGGLTNLLTNPQALSDLTIAAASTGTITLPNGLVLPSQAALITAVSRNSNVNVLSSPTIVTTDNQEAEIIVGQNVPFVTGTQTDTTNINSQVSQIDRQDVGITLRITPQISTGDFLNLQIFVEISDVVPGTQGDPNGPTTTIRTTETAVEVKDNQMIVTGGLIADNVTQATRGVPYFEDIPFFGWLFKRENQVTRRTNLLVFITPKIITDQYDARDVTIESRDNLSKTIQEGSAEPTREDILFSENIDNVAEVLTDDSRLPSTITGTTKGDALAPHGDESEAAMSRLKQRFDQLKLEERERLNSKESNNPTARGDSPAVSEEVLDITVKPKLPAPAPKVLDMSDDARGRLGSKALKSSSQIAGPTVYVVLREVRSENRSHDSNAGDSKTGPLKYSDDKLTVAITYPAAAGTPAAQFFQAGGKYAYKSKDGEKTLVCLGRFSSVNEAAIISPVLSGPNVWHSLSPYEILTLGEGSWTRQ